MNEELLNRKLEYWENQLLDLGKRNKMISFRETKRATLKILEPDFATLYERLIVQEEELMFQKTIDKDFDIRVYSVLSLMDSLSAPVEVRLGDIRTAGTAEESKKTLKNLRNKARLSLDEQGTNILYMVFGFIEWREKGSKGAAWIKSPLILAPVSIVLESLNAPYTLKKYEDDVVVNPTLAYLFERDYGIDLPNFDPEEDSLDDFMDTMEIIADARGWRILRESSLGLVSFLKISMYKDLLNNEDDIKNNPIIQAFAGDAEALNTDAISEIDFDHDKEKSTDLYQVVDADSSQQDAIVLSQKGISFVMQGPPGTGKSQTITNIIAQGLADGKKILFVSEKMAALEVVYKRLAEVHLSDFCLALHSYKANKKDVLEQLKKNLNLKRIKVKDEELAKLTRLDVLREKLKEYVEDIHTVIMPLEMSLYEVYGAIVELQDVPDVRISLPGIEDYSRDKVNRFCLLVENLEKNRAVLGVKWYKNPWQGVTFPHLSNVQKQELKEKLETIIWLLKKAPNMIVSDGHTILELCELGNVGLYNNTFVLADRCKGFPQNWIGGNLLSEKELLSCLKMTKKRITELMNEILKDYQESFLEVDTVNFLRNFELHCREMRDFVDQNCTSDIMFAECLNMQSMLQKYYEAVNSLANITAKLNKAYCNEKADDSVLHLKRMLDACEILLEKKKIQDEIDNIESEILTECEKNIFEIDFESMINRFKIDYTSFFRFLKKQYRDDIKQLRLAYKNVKKKIVYEEAIALLQKLKRRSELFESKQTELDKAESMLAANHLGDINSVLTEKEVDNARKLILDLDKYRSEYPNIQQNSIEELLLRIVVAQNTIGELIEDVGNIKSYLKTSISYCKIEQDLGKVNKYKAAIDEYAHLIKKGEKTFSFMTIGDDTDWEFVESYIVNVESLFNFSKENEISPEWIRFITDSEKEAAAFEVRKFIEAIAGRKTLFIEFVDAFEQNSKSRLMQLERLKSKVEKCLHQFDSVDAWIDYRDCKAVCEESGLAEFVQHSEDMIYSEGKLGGVFLKAFYYSWIEKKIASMKAVNGFNARLHTDNVEKFRELDSHQLPVAQMRIREKLINGMPDKSVFNRTGDEMSVLLHELGKKRKIMPLRKLFRSIPNLLLKLKPCLMMSPLSVSYFLEADTYKFDMVIFDEASQIFPQDAIGAIFRGAQVIIAGDSKQLPPTNFFSTSTNNDMDFDSDDDDEEEIISDSILEEATNTIPNRSLLWHYRSRYEDLISFSNREIYGNKLVTFPSSKINEADTGVEYIYVKNGVYENRCNKEEADKCVQLIEQHIKKYPKRSLGIIAFSESQQSAIEDAVHEFRKKHHEYEDFFNEEQEEAFFIKNLENVQGDERDTIIFSICYGKNAQGRMYMRFGPLGHQGGERRLNVAVTRAKYNIKLVGSIQPEDIDLNKTKSEGVRMLRSYIEFASRRTWDAISLKHAHGLYETDVFCESVAGFLEERGYKVKKHVGSSDYTVDIAIEHPNISGAYIAGIECDGDSYYHARTVRDRDHLRSAVMERMGWKMYRVWSTEWIQNEQEAKRKLIKFISVALKTYSAFEIMDTAELQETEIVTEEISNYRSRPETVNLNNPYNLDKYQEGHWWEVKTTRGYDNESQMADRIHEIVRVEQPIHIELLFKRMAGCFGNEKVTAPIRHTVDFVMKNKMSEEVQIDKDNFVVLSDLKKVKVRRSLPGNPDRSIEYISIQELEEAIKIVLTGAYGVEIASLILETARIFGFEKTGVKIKRRINMAMESLEHKGDIRVADGRVQLLEE